ncbi:hypothetical protein CT0861_11517 [Colletotrichum tofieldiae]|uniref:Uncharacterized protein n=1 Tax=Colletotrichum tofieldiae TaxID=708197 RepID=A0A166NIW7_9PEZI|nr:hypothetical protein CT0861_11517 [Colletotrichum tofieldiae]
MLLLLTAQAQTAPSSFHSHLQRHRDRAATHAHLSHQHSQLAKRTEAAPMKLLQDAVPATHHLATEKPSAPSPYDQSALTSMEYGDGRPRVTSTETEAFSRRETDAKTAIGQPEPERFKLTAARGGSGFRSVADSTDSRHIEAAMRLLRAHAIVKHNKFQREI